MDGRATPEYEEIGCILLDGVTRRPFVAIGPDRQTLAYFARTGESWRLVWRGETSGDWDWMGYPLLSPDGRHIAYPAYRDGTWFVYVDQSPVGNGYDEVVGLAVPGDAPRQHGPRSRPPSSGGLRLSKPPHSRHKHDFSPFVDKGGRC